MKYINFKSIFYFIFIFIISIESRYFVVNSNGDDSNGGSITTLYVNLNSNYNSSDNCGSTLENACQTISDAIKIFIISNNNSSSISNSSSNSNNGSNSDNSSSYIPEYIQYPPLHLIISEGIYSGINNTNINLFGFNITFQGINQVSLVFNNYTLNNTILFIVQPNFNTTNITTNTEDDIEISSKKIKTFINFIDIEFQVLNNLIMYSNNSQNFEIYILFNNCSISNSNSDDYQSPIYTPSTTTASNTSFVNLPIPIYPSLDFNDINKYSLFNILGVTSLIFINTNFTMNQGGIINSAYSTIYFNNVNFINNNGVILCTMNSFSDLISLNQVLIESCSSKYTNLFNETLLNVTDTNFYNNNAYQGGALFLSNSSATIQNSIFKKNTAKFKGGAISTINSYQLINLEMIECKFINNYIEDLFNSSSSSSGGGSIDGQHPKIIIPVQCVTSTCGGSLYASNCQTIQINLCSFDDSYANFGSTLYLKDIYEIDLAFSSISNSKAEYGSIYSISSNVGIYDFKLINNTATDEGSFIYCYNSSMYIRNVKTEGHGGDTIYCDNDPLCSLETDLNITSLESNCVASTKPHSSSNENHNHNHQLSKSSIVLISIFVPIGTILIIFLFIRLIHYKYLLKKEKK